MLTRGLTTTTILNKKVSGVESKIPNVTALVKKKTKKHTHTHTAIK